MCVCMYVCVSYNAYIYTYISYTLLYLITYIYVDAQ